MSYDDLGSTLFAGLAIAVLISMITLVAGGILLWALNTLGYFAPFTWDKAFAMGLVLIMLRGSVK